MAVSIDKQTFTLQFQKKVTLELAVLNQKLSQQLRNEITQAYEQSLYTDLEVSVNCGGGGGGGGGAGGGGAATLVRAHSCIVQSRAPKFYAKVCANRRSVVLPDRADRHSIEAFFRTLYFCNDVNQEENDILKQLGNLKRFYQQQQQQQVVTPESDVYLTPQASPSDGGCTNQRFSTDSFVLDDSSSHLDSHKNNAALYYSLVPIDEVFDSDCSTGGGALEKELAEQDQLFKSFKSILNKEQRTGTTNITKLKKKTKPTSLSLTSSLNPKHYATNIDRIYGKRKLDNIKQEVKSCGRRNSEEENTEQEVKSIIGENRKKNSEEEEELVKSTNRESSLNNCNRNVQSSLDMEQSTMNKLVNKVESAGGVVSKETDDTMSNPETEVLDAASSGYVTGSSPRDHTVSMSEETFGVDVTEAASSEDMPHDDVREGGASSSSVSSDGGTWDTTFPPPVTAANLPDLVQVENNLNAVDLFEPARPKNGLSNHLPEEKYTLENHLSCEPEVKQSNGEGKTPEKSPINHCVASKNNFFIDASSLLDESELANLQVTSCVNYCPSDTSSCGEVVVVGCSNAEENQKTCNENGDTNAVNGCVVEEKKSELSPSSELTFEERRTSLIRRNTFELEPDDGKKLVQLVEKSKNVVENSCVENNHEEIIVKDVLVKNNHEEILVKDVVENSCVKNNHEEIIVKDVVENSCVTYKHGGGVVKKPPKSPDTMLIVTKNIQDDEIHSPDSLNNDAPMEVMFEDRNKEEQKRRILDKVNKEKISSIDDSNEYDSVKLYNSGLFYNVENTLDQCFKYDSNKINCDKDDSSVNENGGSSRMSDCSSTLSRSVGSVDRLNRIESMPIVSGGASISDFSPPVSCASPLARRKTEMAPILSGGSVLMNETGQKVTKPKPNAFTASWVVDMSDAVKSPEMRKKKRSDSARSSGSSEEHDDKSDATKKSSNPALGFFIPLDDPKSEKISKQQKSMEDSKSGSQNNINQSCGFFIDLTKNLDKKERPEKSAMPPDKKLFSMFIDISETSSTENVSPKSKTSSPNLFFSKKLKPKVVGRLHSNDLRSSDSQLSSESSIELPAEHPEVARGKHLFSDQLNCTPPPSRQISTNENSTMDLSSQHESRKKGFFMFIEAENSSPVPRRRTLPSGLRPNSQRHSWNLETASKNGGSTVVAANQEAKKEHKRAHSVSVDRTFSVANCDEKKSSSVTSLVKNNKDSILLDSGPASIDDATMQRNSRAMIASWHGPVKPSTELQKVLARKELRESKTVAGFSKQNGGDQSETSLSCDETYDLRTDSVVSDLSSSCKGGNNSTFIVEDVSNVANAATSNMELSTPSHEMVASELSNDSEPVMEAGGGELPTSGQKLQTVKEESSKSFVKLSDMDKDPPPVKLSARKSMTSSMTSNHRMSRSIPEAGSWLENRLMTHSATSRSLGRLFPHLQVRSPDKDRDDINYAATDVSEMSSLQSSMEPSVLEGSMTTTTDEGSVSGGGDKACSRLGEDLLRMFVEEISCDVVVEVGGRRLKAHKCILASRCQYFAAMLSGGWVESAGNVISLQGFSYNAVHFALCHIYSGTSNIPDSINIVELATLADMLCLEGLKEVIMYTLKVKYCHFFHKPCALCTVGVLECLPLAAAYGLDEIYRKSLRWIAKHFVRVWPTKGFATLPRELIDKCLKQHVVHMSVENVLDTVMCCEKLEATIPQVRWADPVFAVTQRLHETAVKFISQHFSGVLASEMFLSFGKDSTWNLERLKKTLMGAVDKLSPDQACRSLSRLHTILAVADSTSTPASPPSEMVWSHEFVALVREVAAQCESCVVKQATRAVRCSGWLQLDSALRQRIQQAACLVIVPGDERRRARMHHSLHRRSEDRSSSCSSSGLRSSDLHQVKVVMSQQNVGARKPAAAADSTTVAATKVLSNRASVPQTTSSTATKAAARSDENAATKTKSWPHRLAEVKSRYLEQRAPLKTTTTATSGNKNNNSNSTTTGSNNKCWSVPAQRKSLGKPIISSSDSSRTSSPAMRRSLGARTLFTQQQQQQRKHSETLSMSTDSLVEVAAPAKQVKSEPVEVNGNVRARATVKKTAAGLTGTKTKSAESLLATRSLHSTNNRDVKDVKLNHNNKVSSPLPLSKRTPNSQTSPRVVTRATKSQAACSPGARRNPAATGVTQQPQPASKDTTKSTSVKRNATYRVQQPSRVSSATPLSPPATKTPAKPARSVLVNNNNNNNLQQRKAVINNNSSSPLLNRVKQQQPQLAGVVGVGSRSGTFLKDEPTVLAKQQPAANANGAGQ